MYLNLKNTSYTGEGKDTFCVLASRLARNLLTMSFFFLTKILSQLEICRWPPEILPFYALPLCHQLPVDCEKQTASTLPLVS